MNKKTMQLIILCASSIVLIAWTYKLFILPQTDTKRETPFAAPSPSSSPLKGASDPNTLQLYGHISKGQMFQKSIGHGLVFKLNPSDYGWYVDIIPEHNQENVPYGGFASIATPPFHGVNALQLEGWHFRNEHNTAANNGSVNAPQEIREFQFVFNDADARTMLTAVEQFTSGKGEASGFSPPVLFGRGKLIMKHIELGNLTRDAQAWIESMDFEVSFDFTPSGFLSY